jgi:uncharacterized protein (TIGR02594 family)
MTAPAWYSEVERRKGLHEVKNKATLMAWLRSDGHTLGDPSKLPWCGDLVETAIRKTLPKEPIPQNPYLARNWLKFGTMVKPCLGAILVFNGGKRPPPSGHVCFYAGEDKTHYHVLGGNQSNAITVMKIAKNRLLGARWPLTAPPPKVGVVTATGPAKVSESEG